MEKSKKIQRQEAIAELWERGHISWKLDSNQKEVYKIFQNMRNSFDYIAITNCKNNKNTDVFNQWKFCELNIHLEQFNINRNFIKCIDEVRFNRHFYIYSHEEFYRNFSE